MFLFIYLTPASTVVKEKNPVRTSILKASSISPQVQSLQDQISCLLTSSESISTQIAKSLNEELDKSIVISHNLIYSPGAFGVKNWVNVRLVSEKTAHSDLKRWIEVSVGSDSKFSDEIVAEMENYSFALYKYNKSGHDLMSWHKPFDKKNFYQYSLDLDPQEVNLIPSDDFKTTVRRNYFQSYSDNNSIAVLVFRKDKIGTRNSDYLLVYDF